MRTVLLCLVFGLPPAVYAQALDASLPDASVGSGGADQSSEENDPTGPCLTSRECDMGATCQGGHCVPTRPRDATTSCSSVGLLGPLGLFAWALRPKRR